MGTTPKGPGRPSSGQHEPLADQGGLGRIFEAQNNEPLPISATLDAQGKVHFQVEMPPRRYTLVRDGNRPLQFDGAIVAEAESAGSPRSHRGAIYKTVAGKFISEFSSWSSPGILEFTRRQAGAPPPPRPVPDKGKAAVFDTLDEAIGWFRPGTLTVELLKKLGRWGPEFVA